MFGSLGWGLAMFFVGIALDHSTAFSSHPCGGPQRFEKNYTICFATFSVLMGAALITATQVGALLQFAVGVRYTCVGATYEYSQYYTVLVSEIGIRASERHM